MTIETVQRTGDHTPWSTKINPVWWLMSGDTWTAPEINNGLPYIPEVKQQWLRNLYWWIRNPAGNLMGSILGLQDYDIRVTGPAPAELVTWYDLDPHGYGFKWAICRYKIIVLPFLSYSGKKYLWYIGWRPNSGAIGFKFNIH